MPIGTKYGSKNNSAVKQAASGDSSSSALPKLLNVNSEIEETSPLGRRKMMQQAQPNGNNAPDSSPHAVMHLKPVNIELSAVTSVKIVSSKRQESPPITASPQPELQSLPPHPPPKFVSEHASYKSSKHFVELDGLGVVGHSRQSPPPFISAVTPKMQSIVWGSGGFPARLKPVRVKRPTDNSYTLDKSSSQYDNLRPLEPKLFDFNVSDRNNMLGRESLSDSNEDSEDFNSSGYMAALRLDDDPEGSTMVGKADTAYLDHSNNATNNNTHQTASNHSKSTAIEVTTPVRLAKSSSNDKITQYNTNNSNSTLPSVRGFPPVSAMPVIPPLGHQLASNDNNRPGLPRLPPLKQYQPTVKAEKAKGSQLSNGNNEKSLPSFSMSLVGTKAVNSVNALSTQNISSDETITDDGHRQILSLSSTHAELSSALRRKDKKPIILS